MAENSPVREWVSTAGRQGYWYLPFIIPAASGMCDCICLKSLKVFVGMSVVRRIHISSSVDSLLCLPLVSPHGLSRLVALEYLDVLHDSLELSRCISQERASHAQVAPSLRASLWRHTASLLPAHLAQVVVTIPLQKKFKRESTHHTSWQEGCLNSRSTWRME